LKEIHAGAVALCHYVPTCELVVCCLAQQCVPLVGGMLLATTVCYWLGQCVLLKLMGGILLGTVCAVGSSLVAYCLAPVSRLGQLCTSQLCTSLLPLCVCCWYTVEWCFAVWCSLLVPWCVLVMVLIAPFPFMRVSTVPGGHCVPNRPCSHPFLAPMCHPCAKDS